MTHYWATNESVNKIFRGFTGFQKSSRASVILDRAVEPKIDPGLFLVLGVFSRIKMDLLEAEPRLICPKRSNMNREQTDFGANIWASKGRRNKASIKASRLYSFWASESLYIVGCYAVEKPTK